MTLCESADRQKLVADDMYRKHGFGEHVRRNMYRKCLFCEHMNMQVKK